MGLEGASHSFFFRFLRLLSSFIPLYKSRQLQLAEKKRNFYSNPAAHTHTPRSTLPESVLVIESVWGLQGQGLHSIGIWALFKNPQPVQHVEKILQCTSDLYRNTPPICNAMPCWLLSFEEREMAPKCHNTPPICTTLYCRTPHICTSSTPPICASNAFEEMPLILRKPAPATKPFRALRARKPKRVKKSLPGPPVPGVQTSEKSQK